MYGCESWTIKKAEHRRIDAFKLRCWRRFLRVPWTARRSNQVILKEISPEYSLEGLMLKLNLQYFGHLMRRANSLEKTLLLGKIEGRRRRGRQRMRCLDGIIDSMDLLLLLLLSHFSRVQLCATPQTAAHQAPPSLGFSRQEHWSGGHFLLQCMKVKSESEAAQSCPTLSDPMDCNLSGPSVHGIFQARGLEWVASAFSTKDLRLSKL